jgi:hypothetical protein
MGKNGHILPGRFKNPEGNWLNKYNDGGAPCPPGYVMNFAGECVPIKTKHSEELKTYPLGYESIYDHYIGDYIKPDSGTENFLEMIDPSGFASHDDARRAYEQWQKSGNTFPSVSEALDMFSAVPALGKFAYLRYLDPNSIKAAYKQIPWQQILNLMGSEVGEDKEKKKKFGGSTKWLDQYAGGGTRQCPEGYLWDEKLQDCVKLYTDLGEYRKANQAFQDSSVLYNFQESMGGRSSNWLKSVKRNADGTVPDKAWKEYSDRAKKVPKRELDSQWKAFNNLTKRNKKEPGKKFYFRQELEGVPGGFDTYVADFEKPTQPVRYVKNPDDENVEIRNYGLILPYYPPEEPIKLNSKQVTRLQGYTTPTTLNPVSLPENLRQEISRAQDKSLSWEDTMKKYSDKYPGMEPIYQMTNNREGVGNQKLMGFTYRDYYDQENPRKFRPKEYRFEQKMGGTTGWLDQYAGGGQGCPDGYIRNWAGQCVPANTQGMTSLTQDVNAYAREQEARAANERKMKEDAARAYNTYTTPGAAQVQVQTKQNLEKEKGYKEAKARAENTGTITKANPQVIASMEKEIDPSKITAWDYAKFYGNVLMDPLNAMKYSNEHGGRDMPIDYFSQQDYNPSLFLSALPAAGLYGAGALTNTGRTVISGANNLGRAAWQAANSPIRNIPGLTPMNLVNLGIGVNSANNLSSDINTGYYGSDAPLAEKILKGVETGLGVLGSPGTGNMLLSGARNIGRGYNTVATGNSFLPIAWKVENNIGPLGSSKYLTRNYTDAEIGLLDKYGRGMSRLTPQEWEQMETLTRSGATDFSKGQYPISRQLGYYDQLSDESRAIANLKRGDTFNTPLEKTIRTWSVGVKPVTNTDVTTRLVIPSRYTKNLGTDFAAMPYGDKRLSFIWGDKPNLRAIGENELMGNIPGGFKVIGTTNEKGFRNIIIKPLGGGRSITSTQPGMLNSQRSGFSLGNSGTSTSSGFVDDIIDKANADNFNFYTSEANQQKLRAFRPGTTGPILPREGAPPIYSDFDPAGQEAWATFRNDVLANKYPNLTKEQKELVSNSPLLSQALGNNAGKWFGSGNMGAVQSGLPDEIRYLAGLHESTHGWSQGIGLQPVEARILRSAWDDALTGLPSDLTASGRAEEALATQREVRSLLNDPLGERFYTTADAPEIMSALDKISKSGDYLKNPGAVDMNRLISSLNRIGLGALTGAGIGLGSYKLYNNSGNNEQGQSYQKKGGSVKWLDQYDNGGPKVKIKDPATGEVKEMDITSDQYRNLYPSLGYESTLPTGQKSISIPANNDFSITFSPNDSGYLPVDNYTAPASSTYVDVQNPFLAGDAYMNDRFQREKEIDEELARQPSSNYMGPKKTREEAANIVDQNRRNQRGLTVENTTYQGDAGPSYATQVRSDKKAKPLIENNPQGDRTNVEWFNSFTPEQQEILKYSNYASMFEPELWRKSLQGLESTGRFVGNYLNPIGAAYRAVTGENMISDPLYVVPGYTTETARNVNPLETLSFLQYPQRAVQGQLTNSSYTNPLPFYTYNNYGSSNIGAINAAANMASDPLAYPYIGELPFTLADDALRAGKNFVMARPTATTGLSRQVGTGYQGTLADGTTFTSRRIPSASAVEQGAISSLPASDSFLPFSNSLLPFGSNKNKSKVKIPFRQEYYDYITGSAGLPNLGFKRQFIDKAAAEEMMKNGIDTVTIPNLADPGLTYDREAQNRAFNESSVFAQRWGIKDIEKYRQAEKDLADYENSDIYKVYNNAYGNFLKFVKEHKPRINLVSKQTLSDGITPTLGYDLPKDPKLKAEFEEILKALDEARENTDAGYKKIFSDMEKSVDPVFADKVNAIFKQTGHDLKTLSPTTPSAYIVPQGNFSQDNSKLVYLTDTDWYKDLSDYAKDYMLKNFENVKGFANPLSGESVTIGSREPENVYSLVTPKSNKANESDNSGTFLLKETTSQDVSPEELAFTNAHEIGHQLQQFAKWISQFQTYGAYYDYYINPGDNPLAKRFQNAMVKAKPQTGIFGRNKKYHKTWLADVGELHSDLMGVRNEYAQRLIKTSNYDIETAVKTIKEMEKDPSSEIYDYYINHPEVSQHFEKKTPKSEKAQLLYVLPSVGALVGLGALGSGSQSENKEMRKYGGATLKKGGIKTSAEGYYDYINGYKGVSLSKGGSSRNSWLEKYK